MNERNLKLLWTAFGCIIITEILSYVSFLYPPAQAPVFFAAVLAAAIVTIKNLRWGILLLLAELAVGSQGYLLSWEAGGRISLRMALWIIIMAVWLAGELVNLLRGKNILTKYARLEFWKPLAALVIALLIGGIVGWLGSNDPTFFFLEAKRWLFIAIIFPCLAAWEKREDAYDALAVMLAGATWIALKTLGLVYLFSHPFSFIQSVYDWMRYDLLGEMTRFSGGFFRIFIQSQIFLIPALFAALIAALRNTKIHYGYGISAGVMGAALIASLSRSFWVGIACGLLVGAVACLIAVRPKFSNIIRALGIILASGAISLLAVFIIVRFPFPNPSADFSASLLASRGQVEAGAASRWSLLPVMWKEIKKAPFLGYGFGKALTYRTSDPRVVQSTVNGEYTTYAFEWGWFDIWLKIGILGLFAYIWLLTSLFRASWGLMKVEPSWAIGLMMSLATLAAVHFFTPYLNHPLGFGYLAVIMVILQVRHRALPKV